MANNQFDHGNRAAADFILCAPAKFGGKCALLVKWARAVLEKSGEDRSEGRPLPFAAADRRVSAVKHLIVHEGYTRTVQDASGNPVRQESDGPAGMRNSRPVSIAASAVRVNARSIDNAGSISPQEATHKVRLLEGGRPLVAAGDAQPAIPRHSVTQIDTGQATGCALPRTLSPQETESKARQESAAAGGATDLAAATATARRNYPGPLTGCRAHAIRTQVVSQVGQNVARILDDGRPPTSPRLAAGHGSVLLRIRGPFAGTLSPRGRGSNPRGTGAA